MGTAEHHGVEHVGQLHVIDEGAFPYQERQILKPFHGLAGVAHPLPLSRAGKGKYLWTGHDHIVASPSPGGKGRTGKGHSALYEIYFPLSASLWALGSLYADNVPERAILSLHAAPLLWRYASPAPHLARLAQG